MLAFRRSGRMLLLAMVMTLILGISFTASGQDGTDLESYLPSDVDFYASIRLDDAFIGTLDSLLQTILTKLEATALGKQLGPQVSMMNLPLLLDLGSQQILGNDFENGVRPWMGDRAVVMLSGVSVLYDDSYENDSTVARAVLVAITDSAAVGNLINEKFLSQIPDGFYTQSSANGFTVYTPATEEAPFIAYNNDVLIVGNLPASGLLQTFDTTLVDSETFAETTGMLPENAYNITIYTNGAAFMNRADASMLLLANVIGHQAVGFTLLDDRTLAVDVALNLRNLDSVTSMGIEMPQTGPIDLAFAAHIPTDVDLVLHQTNLRSIADAALASAAMADPTVSDQLGAMVQQMTGLDMEEDILSWLDGDYALVMRSAAQPGEASFFSSYYYGLTDVTYGLGIDFAAVVETSDPAKSQQVVETIGTLLQQIPDENITISREDIAGNSAVVISLSQKQEPPYMFQGEDYAPYVVTPTLAFDLVIGANDQIFVVGTRAIVEEILKGEGGFDTSAQFTEAANYILDLPASLAYGDADGFALLYNSLNALGPQIGNIFTNIISTLGGEPTPTPDPDRFRREVEEAQQLRADQLVEFTQMQMAVQEALAAILSSSSMSATTTEDGDSIIRAVLTLTD